MGKRSSGQCKVSGSGVHTRVATASRGRFRCFTCGRVGVCSGCVVCLVPWRAVLMRCVAHRVSPV